MVSSTIFFTGAALGIARAQSADQIGGQTGARSADRIGGQSGSQSVMKDIVYTAPGTRLEKGDLFLPAGAGPFPLVLYLHGGSWRSGSKAQFSRLAYTLTSRGYAGFSINYDLHPGSFPASWNEARTAIEFLRTHAAQYHLDPQRIAVAGTSAGGELAALLALAPEGPMPGSDGLKLPVVAAIILNGGYDLHVRAHVISRYLGGRCDKMPVKCDDASPENHIHPGAPPFFIGHGSHDHLIPFSQAEHMTANLRKADVPVQTFVAEGGPHMYWVKKRFFQENAEAVEKFLAKTMNSR